MRNMPSGLFKIRGNLGEQLIGCDSDRGGKFSGRANPAANLGADRLRLAQQPPAAR